MAVKRKTSTVGSAKGKDLGGEKAGSQKDAEPISQVLKEILMYPKPIARKKTKAGTSDFPAHLPSDQMIRYLKAKEDKKQAAEEETKKTERPRN